MLKKSLQNVTFCDIETEDLRYIDPNIVKLFQTSQLIVEYLLHSQVGMITFKSDFKDYLLCQRRQFLTNFETSAAKLTSLQSTFQISVHSKQICLISGI